MKSLSRGQFVVFLSLTWLFLKTSVIAVTYVNTHVSATGNSIVKTETNVQSESSSKTDISVSNTSKAAYTDSDGLKTYKKMEISVNGKRQVLETTEPGTHSLTVIEPTTATVSSFMPRFPYEEVHLKDYILEQIRKIFTFFPFLSSKRDMK